MLVFSLACGGGGGGSNATLETPITIEQAIPTVIQKVSIQGKVDFSTVSQKAILYKSSKPFGEVVFKHIGSGAEFLVALNADFSYSIELEQGSYDVTAKSSDGKVLKAVFAGIGSEDQDGKIDLQTTVAAMHLHSMTGSNLEQLSAEKMVKEIKETLTLLRATKKDPSSELMINLLSIQKRVKEVHRTGKSDLLLSNVSIQESITSQAVLAPYREQVTQEQSNQSSNEVVAVQPTIAPVSTPPNNSELTANTFLVPPIQPSLSYVMRMNKNVPNGSQATLDVPQHLQSDEASYQWKQISGTKVQLFDEQTSKASFNMPSVLGAPLYFKLDVSKNGVASSTTVFKVQGEI